MNLDSLPNNTLYSILIHLEIRDILNITLVKKTFIKIRVWDILWSQVLKNYNFTSPFITTSPPIQLTPFEYLKHIFEKLRKIKRSFNHAFLEQNLSSGLLSNDLTKFDQGRAAEILKNFKNHWAGSLPLELYLFYTIYNEKTIENVYEINNQGSSVKILGGFSFYENYYEFTPSELHPPECIFFYNYGFYTIIREVNNAVFIMVDTKNQLGFGDSTLFSILNINQGRKKYI